MTSDLLNAHTLVGLCGPYHDTLRPITAAFTPGRIPLPPSSARNGIKVTAYRAFEKTTISLHNTG